mgnify:CR=1 FL=1
MLVIVLDVIWTFPEAGLTVTFVGILCVPFLSIIAGGLTFATVSLVQYYLDGDSAGQALTKGVVMGIFVGIPYPIMGTLIAVPLAAWAGLKQLNPPQNHQIQASIITVEESE